MKKMLLVCVLLGSVRQVSAAVSMDVLIEALIKKESTGNDLALGDGGLTDKAYGCLQIRQPVCDDVNRKFGTRYCPQDCLGNRDLSIEIFRKYISIWCREDASDEKISRVWNGGPKGHVKASTEKYWLAVRKILERKKGRQKVAFLLTQNSC